ncbi:exopolysaccharide biosynthesis polyprenyl glycosylphosphotransferase [Erythrobacter sp. HL-111]|uniref:exopolysaccharide biosynthesis polyprenyl glycosylphosphotransferase n=1 Tax=Erythrobacter sp. HL-111 TaxID=1798193 RepID=UPI0006DB63E1|nr:exopolysaccharide biosynthesis polyprenyl glycosylphosphotransferase [Erythrobacter sp. HL-111]KPP86884.1 MAG: Sugar transferases involved in lipopolysaccharide synthesis [Erythrobacteraceae bacterium HL-111]SDS83002.1 exopolysaccharide biosynthesis polyprenyl glycosylphosphotransferase [Erythrobacter sp. HL-111]
MNEFPGGLMGAVDPDRDNRKVAPSLERRRLQAYAVLLLLDALLVQAGFSLSGRIYEGNWWERRTMLAAQTMIPLFFTIALYNGTYGVRSLTDSYHGARKSLTALAVSAALLNFVAFYTKSNAEFSRVSVTLGMILTGLAMLGLRWLVPLAVRRFWRGQVRNELVIEDGGPGFALGGATSISAATYDLDPASQDPHMRDRLGKLLRNRDKVVVSCPIESREAWAVLLKSAGVFGEIVSEPVHRIGAIGVHRYEEQGRTALVVSHGPLSLRSRLLKRAFDTCFALVSLVALAPLFVVVAVLIKVEDRGPVFFVQRRMGRGNRFFEMYKFRSMREGRLDSNGDRSTARDDDRITRIGAFIRRTSIDELPQLINVLKGEMSIVGPRPHALGSKANNKLFWDIDANYWQRHCLKPGLTGLAQVRGYRGATEREKDLTDRLQADLEYITGWSLQRDIGILLKTVFVLRHANAY